MNVANPKLLIFIFNTPNYFIDTFEFTYKKTHPHNNLMYMFVKWSVIQTMEVIVYALKGDNHGRR